MAQRVNFLRRRKVNAIDFGNHVAQQVAVEHPVDRAPKHPRHHRAPVVFIFDGQPAQVGEQPGATFTIGPNGFVVVDERDQVRAGQAAFIGSPIAPAIGKLDQGLKGFVRLENRLVFPVAFGIVQKLEEHDPGQHRQPVEVAVKPLILPHQVAGGLNQGAELLGSGGGSGGKKGGLSGLSGHRLGITHRRKDRNHRNHRPWEK